MSLVDLDSIDRKILVALQGDLDDSPEPYAGIASDVSISETEVIQRIKRMQEDGIIRRIGAMIRHIEAGIGFNGMIVWKVEPDRIEQAGRLMAEFPEVTHCYERPPFGDNGGTLFTVPRLVGKRMLDTVRLISEKTGVKDYEILFSERELKKVSMTYFDDEDPEQDD